MNLIDIVKKIILLVHIN